MKINILFFSIWLFWCFNFLVDILHCIYTIFKILPAVLALSVCMIQVFLSNLLFFEKFSSFQQSVYFILQSLNISILKVNWHFNTAFSQNVIFGRFLALVSQISQESTAWKSVQIQSFFWSVFSHIQTEYGGLRSKSDWENSVFGQFSPSGKGCLHIVFGYDQYFLCKYIYFYRTINTNTV